LLSQPARNHRPLLRQEQFQSFRSPREEQRPTSSNIDLSIRLCFRRGGRRRFADTRPLRSDVFYRMLDPHQRVVIDNQEILSVFARYPAPAHERLSSEATFRSNRLIFL